jgi:hypothetical protein
MLYEHFEGIRSSPVKYRVRESRLISIDEDEGKSNVAGGSAVDQINRGQTEHSACDRLL